MTFVFSSMKNFRLCFFSRKLKDPLIRFHYRARKDVPTLLAARLKRVRPFPPIQTN